MIRQIVNKNICEIFRIPLFIPIIIGQLVYLSAVGIHWVDHPVICYLNKFITVLLYFTAAYIASKLMFAQIKSNRLALIMYRPVSRFLYVLLAMISVAVAMLLPVLILCVTIFVSDLNADGKYKLKADIAITPDRSLIKTYLKKYDPDSLGHNNKKNKKQLYMDMLLADSTIMPDGSKEWTFDVPDSLYGKFFRVAYNNFFNIQHRLNTNSYWMLSIGDMTVREPACFDNTSEFLEKNFVLKAKDLSVTFVNGSSKYPVMFVPEKPVVLIFHGNSLFLNILKGGFKTMINMLFIISLSMTVSFFMSVPGVLFTSFMSITGCLLYKFFHYDGSLLQSIFFNNGMNEVLNSEYIYTDKILIGLCAAVIFMVLAALVGRLELRVKS